MSNSYRESADGRVRAVAAGGRMTRATLDRLLELFEAHTTFAVHIELAINTGPMVKTIDNEADALETIERMERKFAPAGSELGVRREKA